MPAARSRSDQPLPSCVRERAEGAVISVRVRPRAGRDRIVGERGGALEVMVKAPPVGGEANRALVRLMARRLRRPQSGVRLIGGARQRKKLVLVERVTAAQVARALAVARPAGR